MPRLPSSSEKAGNGSKRKTETSPAAVSKEKAKKPKAAKSGVLDGPGQPRTILQVNADHLALRVSSPISELPTSRSTTERIDLVENPCPQLVRPLGHPKKGEKDMNDSTVCRFAFCKKKHPSVDHARACEKQHFDLRWSLVQGQSESPKKEAASLDCLIEGCTKVVVVDMDAKGTSAHKQMMRHYEAVHACKRYFCEGGCGFVCSTLAQLNVHTKAMNDRTQKELGAAASAASGTPPNSAKKPKPDLSDRNRKKTVAATPPVAESAASEASHWFEANANDELPSLFGTVDFSKVDFDSFPVPFEDESLLLSDEDFPIHVPDARLMDLDLLFNFNDEKLYGEEPEGCA